jgi:hypothetical protein
MIGKAIAPGSGFGGTTDYIYDGKLQSRGENVPRRCGVELSAITPQGFASCGVAASILKPKRFTLFMFSGCLQR